MTTLVARKARPRRRLGIDGQITDVVENRGLEGAPTLTVSLSDPDWLVTTAPILDLGVDRRLDQVEVEHDGTWYRLVKVSPSGSELTLVFEDRVVSVLRSYDKPFKRRRTDGYSRAMFIRDLVAEANKDGHDIGFYCPQLLDKQQIEKVKSGIVEDRRPGKHTAGKFGFTTGAELTVKGKRATNEQRRLAAQALSVAKELQSPRRAMIALVEAMITESEIQNVAVFTAGSADSLGVLQVRVSTSGSRRRSLDVNWCVAQFLEKGFWGHGGANELARTTTKSPGEIAQLVQGSAYPERYGQHEAEAKAWVSAYTGEDTSGQTPGTTVVVEQAYYFSRGEPGRRESSWDCMNRLAQEVNWALFVAEGVVYYVDELELYLQKPAAVIRRSSPAVTAISYDWDQGKHVSTMELDVLSGRWSTLPGECVEVAGAGPADQRWLVAHVNRARSRPSVDVTLTAISGSKKEPAPQTQEVTLEQTTAADDPAYQALLNACKRISDATPGYLFGGGHGARLSSLSVKQRLDCSSSVSLALYKAGLFPDTTAWVSGTFAERYGDPGEGKLFTVWANADHVWIELRKGPYKRFDTGGPGGGKGPKLHTDGRSSSGFSARHFRGL